jgi:hypothetical protein
MSKKGLIELKDCDVGLLAVSDTGTVFFKVSYGSYPDTRTHIYLTHKELKKLYKLSKKAIRD